MDFPTFSFPGKREIFSLISRETGNSREMHLLSTCIKKSVKNRDFWDSSIQNQKNYERPSNCLDVNDFYLSKLKSAEKHIFMLISGKMGHFGGIS